MYLKEEAKESSKRRNKSKKMDHNAETKCPLCLEVLEMDDLNFYPCKCEYQVCRFCWHRIRTNENGLCPACRRQYPEDPANFKPLSQEELLKIKNQKKMKDMQKKQRQSENRRQLADLRIIQKNLVFVHGLPAGIKTDHAKQEKFIEPYRNFGKIIKSIFNERPNSTGSHTLGCAYITYDRVESALRVLKSSLATMKFEGREVKSSLGTTKYCSNYLKNVHCPKNDCMYLHEVADDEACFTKDDIKAGKHVEYGDKLYQQMVANQSKCQTSYQQGDQSSTEQRTNNCRGSPEDAKHNEQSCSKNDSYGSSPQEANHHPLYNRHSQIVPEGDAHFPALTPDSKNPRTNAQQNPSAEQTSPHLTNGDTHINGVSDGSWMYKPNSFSNLSDVFISNHSHENRRNQIDSFFSTDSGSGLLYSRLSLYTNHNSSNPNPGILEEHDDDLGFDPCQVSLEGLEDLLSTEAKDLPRPNLPNNGPNSFNETHKGSGMNPQALSALYQLSRMSGNPPPGFSGSTFSSQPVSSSSGFERNSLSNRLSPIVDLLNPPILPRQGFQTSPRFQSSSALPSSNSLPINGYNQSPIRNLSLHQMFEQKEKVFTQDPRLLRGMKNYSNLSQMKFSNPEQNSTHVRPPSPVNHRMPFVRSNDLNRPAQTQKFHNFTPFSNNPSLFPNLLSQDSKGIHTFP